VERLLDAGATRGSAPSKLARALGDLLPEAPSGADGSTTPSSTAGDVVRAYLREQVDQLQLQDPRVRRDEEDSVHKMRVATRRLRSALATYRPLLDREVTEPLRAELKWLGGVLGRPRDAEVLQARLTALLDEQPPELVLGPVRRRLDAATQGEYRDGHRELLATLDGERYLGLLDALDALADDPPFTDAASGSAKKVVRRRVHRTWKRVRSAARAADEAPPEERAHLLHEVRKSAKRARYAGESVAGTFGSDAEEFAAAFEDLQDVLGELQDSVVAREVLRRVGVEAHLDGENGLTYGLLLGLELGRSERAVTAYDPAWAAASAKSLRQWLR
jgi:CHAD domain-containing protein